VESELIEVMNVKIGHDSIRVNREFDPNEMDDSDLHDEKHDEQRISTLDGIIID
jgi:hypothetical protein